MKRSAAFTLLELSVTIVVVAILAVLAMGVTSKLRARAQRIQCTANLRSLHVAAQLYMQEHQVWPQYRPGAQEDEDWSSFAKQWIAALAPHGPTAKTWICATRQNMLGNPDYLEEGKERIDYIPTPFDDKPTTPFDMGTPKQGGQGVAVPWFSESEDVHGNGNLFIFADGSVTDLKSIVGATPAPK